VVEQVRPNLRRLSFAFDIGDYTDDWLDILYGLLRTLHCTELTSVLLNWKETPAKSPKIVEGSLMSWSATTFSDFASYHRRRQRLFASFFETFVSSAVNVVNLTMPFDWSSRSLQASAVNFAVILEQFDEKFHFSLVRPWSCVIIYIVSFAINRKKCDIIIFVAIIDNTLCYSVANLMLMPTVKQLWKLTDKI